MAETARDNNKITVVMGVLNTDGATPTRIKADSSSHIFQVSDGTTGSDFGKDLAARDNSGVPVMIAVSEVDGITPVTIYVNSSNQLLMDST